MSGPDSSSPELSELQDGDVLKRAAAALRAAHSGQRDGSGFTRARILASVAERRRPRWRRWLVLAPLGSALLVGSAWAQSTGSWPRVWQAVTTVLPFLEADHREERAASPAGRAVPAGQRGVPPPEPPPAEQPAPAAEAQEPEPSEPEPPEPPAEPPLSEPALTAPPAPARPGRPRRAAPSAPEPAPDPELRRFRAAHELHVQGQPRAAIAAYEEYLQEYPSGRFVPEARYNSALDAIKVGELDAARGLLEPFAAGVYGEYRRAEAQRLLEALSAAGSR